MRELTGHRVNPANEQLKIEVLDEPGAGGANQSGEPREHIMQFFAYAHLPTHLQAVSKPFCDLASLIVAQDEMPAGTPVQFPLPRNPERTVALRKLLEAKDAAVRALIAK